MKNLPALITGFFGVMLFGVSPLRGAYSPFFFNRTGCLYAYLEGGKYDIAFPEPRTEPQQGNLRDPTFDPEKSNCTNGKYRGNLVVTLLGDSNNMNTMTIEFHIQAYLEHGYWEITRAHLTINPANDAPYNNKTQFEMKVTDLYAGESHSFSCNQFLLTNLRSEKVDPLIKVTLKRFQLQPFREMETVVFAPSYDCSVWITMPVLMGTILMLFITFTVMIGVYLMLELGNQAGNMKFSKQGGMLMNQAQLDATKG